MEIESNNERYYLIIAGILVFTVLSIFVVLVLGFGGHLMSNLNIIPSNNGVFPLDSKDDFSNNAGTIEIGSVPEKGVFGPFDTKPGEMKIFDQYLPVDPLPLKITDDYLN
ncbi:MAG: hypothetical protein ACFFAV_09020, partial [Candidatus Hermodarchaeota archaeon]